MDLEQYLAKPSKTVRMHTDELLESAKSLRNFSYIADEVYFLLKKCCEYHDYGKVNKEFQKRVSSNKKLKFDEKKEVAHNVLSLCFVPEEKFDNEEDYYRALYAIINHHHNVDNYEEFKEKKDLIDEFVKEYEGKNLKRRLIKEVAKFKDDKKAILLKGLLHRCDYAASGEYTIEYPSNFLIEGLEELLNRWKDKNENADWNELQSFCIRNREKNLMVIANTGMGKTEAGLLWIGNNKGYFILPLRTAINAIFERISKEIVCGCVENKVALLHSESLAHFLKDESDVEDEKAVQHAQKGKNLSLPLTISTLDQLFNFVYKYNGFELKLATLSYSKIVIDEIQAYSPELLAYLVVGLEEITKLGGKFAILTATLAPFVRDFIEENISGISKGNFVNGEDRHNLKVENKILETADIITHFKGKGGKTLLICNTVKKAQEVYETLEKEFDEKTVKLIHSKFMKKDRTEKESLLLEFGKTEVKGNKIWVATAIVEASLDIDFDYLFTELNDLNGLFQRLGRVNRKGEKTQMLHETNVFVYTEIDKKLLISENGKRGYIDKRIYEISKEALLKEVTDVLPEAKKAEIIEKYFISENIKDSNFEAQYRTMKNYIKSLYIGEKNFGEVQQMFRNIISYNVIPQSQYKKDNIRKIIDKNLAVINEEHKKLTDKEKRYNDKLKLDKLRAKKEIYNYTVPVGAYDLNKVDKIDLGHGEIIDIVRCEYDDKRGFKRVLQEKQVEKFDNFS